MKCVHPISIKKKFEQKIETNLVKAKIESHIKILKNNQPKYFINSYTNIRGDSILKSRNKSPIDLTQTNLDILQPNITTHSTDE